MARFTDEKSGVDEQSSNVRCSHGIIPIDVVGEANGLGNFLKGLFAIAFSIGKKLVIGLINCCLHFGRITFEQSNKIVRGYIKASGMYMKVGFK